MRSLSEGNSSLIIGNKKNRWLGLEIKIFGNGNFDAAKHDHCSFATIINKPLHFALFSGEGKKWILWEEKHKGFYRFFTEI